MRKKLSACGGWAWHRTMVENRDVSRKALSWQQYRNTNSGQAADKGIDVSPPTNKAEHTLRFFRTAWAKAHPTLLDSRFHGNDNRQYVRDISFRCRREFLVLILRQGSGQGFEL
jgi:hypothetical protein